MPGRPFVRPFFRPMLQWDKTPKRCEWSAECVSVERVINPDSRPSFNFSPIYSPYYSRYYSPNHNPNPHCEIAEPHCDEIIKTILYDLHYHPPRVRVVIRLIEGSIFIDYCFPMLSVISDRPTARDRGGVNGEGWD